MRIMKKTCSQFSDTVSQKMGFRANGSYKNRPTAWDLIRKWISRYANTFLADLCGALDQNYDDISCTLPQGVQGDISSTRQILNQLKSVPGIYNLKNVLKFILF